MAEKNWKQIYDINPIISFQSTDIFYTFRSPYGISGDDCAFTYGSLIPITTKGDLFTFSTVNARLGVGANGTFLTADSAQTTGLKWANITPADISGIVPLSKGGTNADLSAAASLGGIVYSTATAFGVLPGVAANGAIISSVSGGAPQWTVATYPTSTSINQILYSSANNVVDAIASGSQGVLVTNTSSVPSFTFPSTNNSGYLLMSTQNAAPAFSNYTFPTDANLGDIIYGSTIGAFQTLSGNSTTTRKYLSELGTGIIPTAPTWEAISGSDITGSALTKVDDTNVTLTLGGTPATSLLRSASITAGWTGLLAGTRGGTGVNNGASTLTYGGNVTFSGAFTFTGTVTGNTSVTFPTSGTLATTSQIPTGAALTKTDDTNVTLTLGGSPTTALVNAASLTLGWTGQLGLTRGGTNASLTASNGGLIYSTATGMAVLSGTATANQIPLSGASGAPSWSTATYPGTTTANQVLYSSSANTVAGLATGNNGVLVTDGSGVPSISSTLPTAVQGNITSTGTLGNQLNTTRACFHAYYAAGNQNFSKGVETTVAFDTERFDQGNNFASNTFTAPVTGKYVFNVNIGIVATNAATEFYCYLLASGTTYFLQECDPTFAGSAFGFSASIIVAMSSGDTAVVKTFASGGTGTYSIFSGNGGPNFSGYLLC